MQNEYPVSVSIVTLRFDRDGSGEKEAYTYAGRVSEGDRYTLTYTASEDGQKTVLSFCKEQPETICLLQSGEVSCELCFEAGRGYTALYRVAGAGELDIEIKPRVVTNEAGERARRIRLDYEATIGGARMRTVMTLIVERIDIEA
ncbi:MAG: DUF1934 family protein [Clostridia bacterium]|nr:DUF1934 family protein [Clostridia bacterium]